MNLSWPAKLLIAIVVLIPIADALYNNPVRIHQSVKVTDYTLDVPLFWTPTAPPRKEMLVAFRREWARSGTIDVVDRARVNAGLGSWTREAAERSRAFIVAVEQKDPRFSGQRFFETRAGNFPAICTESTLGSDNAFTCYVIGTRLQFSYLGSKRYEGSALKMLRSLH
jgi:hypothetical protein